MEIINTLKQSIAKIFDGTTVFVSFCFATDEDGCAVENFCNTLFKCIFQMVFNFFLFYLDLLLFYTTHKTLTVIDYLLLYGYLRTNKTFYPSRAPGSIHITHLFS